MSQFRAAKKRITVSVGESVRIVRELQGLSQNQLAERTGIPLRLRCSRAGWLHVKAAIFRGRA